MADFPTEMFISACQEFSGSREIGSSHICTPCQQFCESLTGDRNGFKVFLTRKVTDHGEHGHS